MSSTLTVKSEMASKRRGSDKPKRNDAAVKVDKLIVSQAKFVADRRGQSIAEYLSDLLRAPVKRDFDKALREMEDGD